MKRAALIFLLLGGALRAATPPDPLVAVPTGLSGQIALSWADVQPAGTATGYEVFEASYAFADLSGVTYSTHAVGTALTQTGETDGAPEYFFVAADTSFTAQSAQAVSATPYAAAPQNVSAVATGASTHLLLSWSGVTVTGATVTSYSVYEDSSSAFSAALVVTDVAGTSVDLTVAADGATVWLAVSPDLAGTAQSATVSAASYQRAPAPQLLSVTSTGKSGQLWVSWSAVTVPAGITGYQVYRASYPSPALATPFYVPATSTVVSGLSDGVVEWFAVQAAGAVAADTSLAVSSTSVPFALPPNAVTLSPTGVSGQVLLSWGAVTPPPTVTGYQVFRATYPDLSAASPISYTTGLSFLDNGLSDGTLYWYAVAADLGGEPSTPLEVVPFQPLDAPASLSLTPLSYGAGIEAQWTASVTHGYPAGAYQLLQLNGTSFSVVQTVGAGVTATVLSLPCATGLTLAVQAVDVLGLTSVASAVSWTSYPCAPVATALGLSNSAMLLGWAAAPSAFSPASQYRVYYANVSGLPDPLPNADVTVTGSALFVTATALPQRQTRYYRVYSVDAAGVTSTGSNEIGVLAPPSIADAAGRRASVLLDWARPSPTVSFKLSNYEVYYATYGPPVPSAPGTFSQSVIDPGLGAFAYATVSANLSDGIPDYFALSAMGGDGLPQEGALGLTASATPGLPSPVITQLTQTKGGPLNLAWSVVDASPDTPATYEVFGANDASLTGLTMEAAVTGTALVLTVTPGTLQYWFVAISDTAGNSSTLSPAAGALLFAPTLATPSVSVALTSNSRVMLTWTAVPYASEYQIYRATQGVSSTSTALFTTQNSWIVQASSFIDTAPVNGQVNLYEVLARLKLPMAGSQVESALSLPSSAMPAVPPSIPGIFPIVVTVSPGISYYAIGAYLTATARPTLNAVDLSWTASNLGSHLLANYVVYDGFGFSNLSPVALLSATVTSCTLSVTDPLGLSYGVVAVDVSGNASPMLTGTASPYLAWPAPQTPTAFTLGTAVRLAWSPPITPTTGTYPFASYEVLRKDLSGEKPQSITHVAGTSYIDTTAGSANSSQLTYSIRVVDSLGLPGAVTKVGATYSAPAPVTVAPSVVANITARVLTGTALSSVPVLIRWQGNPQAEQVSSYAVYVDGTHLLDTTLTGAVDDSALVNSSHSYQVQGVNAFGAGLSGTASPSPLSVDPPQPRTVSVNYAVDATGSTLPALRLQWSDAGVPIGVSAYAVYRTANGGSPVELASVTVAAYTDNDLTDVASALTLSYTVSGEINGFESASPVAQLFLPLPSLPAAPAGLTVSAGNNGMVTLSWTAEPSAQQFWVYRSTAALGPYPGLSPIAVLNGGLSYTETSATTGIQNYAVAGVNFIGRGPASFVSVTPLPGVVTGLTATAQYTGTPQISVSWSAAPNSSLATGYEISRGLTGTSAMVLQFISATITTYVDSTAVTNTAYYYQVRGYNVGFGPLTYTGAVADYLPPSAPAGLRARGGTSNIDVSWDEPSSADGVTGYALTVLPWGPSQVPQSVTLPAQPNAYSVTGLAAAKGVTFTLTAFNSAGASPVSLPQSAVVNALGPVPEPLSLTAKVGFYESSTAVVRVLLSWSPADPSQNFQIYRSTGALPLGLAADGPVSPYYLTGVPGSLGGYTDTAVTSTQAYSYAVTAVGPGGLPAQESLPVAVGPVTPFSFPGPGDLPLTVTAGMSRVDLQWGPPPFSGTAGLALVPYRLYRYTSSAGVALFKTLAADPGFPLSLSATVYSDTQVTNGTAYQYAVSVVDGLGREQDAAETRLDIVPKGPLHAPNSVSAIPGNASVTLRWVANLYDTSQALTYDVYRRNETAGEDYGAPIPELFESGPTSTQVFLSPVTQTVVTLRDGGPGSPVSLSNTTTYCYSIAEVNALGEGPKSQEVCVTPFSPLVATVAALTLTVVNKSSVMLAWNPAMNSGNSYALKSFRVYRSRDGGGTYTLLSETAALAVSYVDNNTQFGAAYVYRVVPVDTSGNEGLSYDLGSVVIPAAANAILLFRNGFDPALGESVPIQFSLVQPGHVWVRIYTMQGEFVKDLQDQFASGGASVDAPANTSASNPWLSQKIVWDGTNAAGHTVASGVYLIHLEAPGYHADARVAVIK